MEKEKTYRCKMPFSGLTGREYKVGQVLPESEIHIFGQSNFKIHFEEHKPLTEIITDLFMTKITALDNGQLKLKEAFGHTITLELDEVKELRNFLNQLELGG